jgi:D-alanine-D-alanine ligase
MGMKSKLRVGLVANQRVPGDDSEFNFERSSEETLQAISESIEYAGGEVEFFEADKNIGNTLDGVKNDVDIVFNIAEYIPEHKNRKAMVPLHCYGLGIPYTGSNWTTQMVGQSKGQTRLVLGRRVPQPTWQEFERPDDELKIRSRSYPVFVKPSGEGSSMGIFEDNIVNSASELRQVIARMVNQYGPAIAEQYLAGKEYNKAIIADNIILPGLGWDLNVIPGDHKVKTRDLKNECGKYAGLVDNPGIEMQLARYAAIALDILKVNDYCRLDFRAKEADDDGTGKPYVLEANLLPSLSKGASLMQAASAAGLDYRTVIQAIIYSALLRQGQTERYQDRFDDKQLDGFMAAYNLEGTGVDFEPKKIKGKEYRILRPAGAMAEV